jgi:D-alanyl-D-alanine dipeptidase
MKFRVILLAFASLVVQTADVYGEEIRPLQSAASGGSQMDWRKLAPFSAENNPKLEAFDIGNRQLPIVLDLRYSSTRGFTGVRMYPNGLDGDKLYLHKECVPKLVAAGTEMKKRGDKCKLVVFDGARPCSAQIFMWDVITSKPSEYPEPSKYVADPAGCKKNPKPEDASKVSMHNRGLAIDLSMDCSGGAGIPKKGEIIATMGGDFDDFKKAKFALAGLTKQQASKRAELREIMINAGFLPYDDEWWHFNCRSKPTDVSEYPKVL